ncbi:hypothetical protein HDF16_005512 [Granulicella aggregans]|uniref:Uncharacterized protein n=1 Tax=Granulicella aggregans TaxID=474949 RepID=A0A7W7ZK94_9BACT|nr:hypothetical protein [Granulicella aggregans]
MESCGTAPHPPTGKSNSNKGQNRAVSKDPLRAALRWAFGQVLTPGSVGSGRSKTSRFSSKNMGFSKEKIASKNLKIIISRCLYVLT